MMKPSAHKDNYMKKFKILLSLITITFLLASCGSILDFYGDENYGDWATPDTE